MQPLLETLVLPFQVYEALQCLALPDGQLSNLDRPHLWVIREQALAEEGTAASSNGCLFLGKSVSNTAQADLLLKAFELLLMLQAAAISALFQPYELQVQLVVLLGQA